jgi:hypothetical protein
MIVDRLLFGATRLGCPKCGSSKRSLYPLAVQRRNPLPERNAHAAKGLQCPPDWRKGITQSDPRAPLARHEERRNGDDSRLVRSRPSSPDYSSANASPFFRARASQSHERPASARSCCPVGPPASHSKPPATLSARVGLCDQCDLTRFTRSSRRSECASMISSAA